MVDNNLLFEDIPYDQPTPVFDVSGYTKIIPAAQYARGNCISFTLTAQLEWSGDPHTGTYLDVMTEAGNWLECSFGIGSKAIVGKGIHFTLPSNVDRFLYFQLRGNELVGGTYTIWSNLVGV